MIFARLHGRLGNQMFQYAAARSLAARLGTGVALDTRGAIHRGEGVLTRVFDLALATPAHLPPVRHENPARYALWRLTGARPKLRREKGLGYNPAFTAWDDNSYLHGYWQSEKYFDTIAHDIRTAFEFAKPASPQNVAMAKRIQQTTSVSLHVRRGDYLTVNAHAICDQSYYDQALQRLALGLNTAPTVYVFSDDPEWAKSNLPLPFEKIVVDHNGPDTDYEDMRLMSLCQHNIIANSSFSWWAAWLNRTPHKTVAGPSNWFADPKLNNPDILPAGWMKI
jgi:hypothetical protein